MRNKNLIPKSDPEISLGIALLPKYCYYVRRWELELYLMLEIRYNPSHEKMLGVFQWLVGVEYIITVIFGALDYPLI